MSALSFHPELEHSEVMLREDGVISQSHEAILARNEVLRHVLELVQTEARIGIKRQATPDAKVAKRRHLEGCPSKQVPVRTSTGHESACQVCGLEQRRWVRDTPLLVNAMGKAVQVPGRFCSQQCYEHV